MNRAEEAKKILDKFPYRNTPDNSPKGKKDINNISITIN